MKELPGFTLNASVKTQGRALAVLGPSGAGKSLLLRCLAGLERPTDGRVVINGRPVFDHARALNIPSRDRHVGHVFQNYALFPNLSVADNIAFGLRVVDPAERRRRVAEWLEAMDLAPFADLWPEHLSGGQCQRVALARALASEPDLLLLDEPLAALDTHLKTRIELLLKDAVERFSGVTLMVTHSLEEAFRICEDLVILDNGSVIAAGEKHAVFNAPGTVTAAALTGCKNIEEVRIEGAHAHVDAWGVSLPWLKVSGPAKHVGIRAHHIRIFPHAAGGASEYPCRLVSASETPHRMTLLVMTALGTKPLQVEVLKDVWEALRDAPEPWYISLPPERLLALIEHP